MESSKNNWKPMWRERCAQASVGQPAGDKLVDRVIARRKVGSLTQEMLESPSLMHGDDPNLLPDAGRAASRIAMAVMTGQKVAIETDYDVDGSTSHVIIKHALIKYFGCEEENIKGFVGQRLTEGYGLSDPLTDRILEWSPDLVITADNGSTDEPRISRLLDHGIDTVVTDHHAVEGSGPPSAQSCVNPNRADSKYPDKAIAGCAVAFLVMCLVRGILIESDQDSLRPTIPKLRGLLDMVALGTVADCVSLGESKNNRGYVRYGLKIINQRKRPCWKVALDSIQKENADAETLAFQIGPRINARTRLSDPMAAIEYLDTYDDQVARSRFDLLTEENETRKGIESDMRDRAFDAMQEWLTENPDHKTLVSFDPEGHPGVHGIVASRLVEKFGRASVCLSPKLDDSGLITGSCRGIPGFDIHAILRQVNEKHPDLMMAWGGHTGAGGLTLNIDTENPGAEWKVFREAFEYQAREIINTLGRNNSDIKAEVGPVIWHDGRVRISELTHDAIANFERMGPWGRGFDAPSFVFKGIVSSLRTVGADGTHLKIDIECADDGKVVSAIWFRALNEGDAVDTHFQVNDTVEVVARPQINRFRGKETVQVLISDARLIAPGNDGGAGVASNEQEVCAAII